MWARQLRQGWVPACFHNIVWLFFSLQWPSLLWMGAAQAFESLVPYFLVWGTAGLRSHFLVP